MLVDHIHQPSKFNFALQATTTTSKENWRTNHTKARNSPREEFTLRTFVCRADIFFLFEKDRHRSCREIETGVSFTLVNSHNRPNANFSIMFFLLDQWRFCRAKSKVSTCDNSTYPRKGKMNMPTIGITKSECIISMTYGQCLMEPIVGTHTAKSPGCRAGVGCLVIVLYGMLNSLVPTKGGPYEVFRMGLWNCKRQAFFRCDDVAGHPSISMILAAMSSRHHLQGGVSNCPNPAVHLPLAASFWEYCH